MGRYNPTQRLMLTGDILANPDLSPYGQVNFNGGGLTVVAPKFGAGSMQSAAISIFPSSFYILDQPFCLQYWVYTVDAIGDGGGSTYLHFRQDSFTGPNNQKQLLIHQSTLRRLGFYAYDNSGGFISGVTSINSLPLGAWAHVAVLKNLDGFFRVCINGVQEYSSGFSTFGSPQANLATQIASAFTGYVDDLQFVIGREVYTSFPFTPPTASLYP